jgi:hypothetical protein
MALWRWKVFLKFKLAFHCQLIISVQCLLQHNLISDVLSKRQSVANFLKGFSCSEANSFGGNNTPAPIGKADQILQDEFSTNCDFEDFLVSSPGIT